MYAEHLHTYHAQICNILQKITLLNTKIWCIRFMRSSWKGIRNLPMFIANVIAIDILSNYKSRQQTLITKHTISQAINPLQQAYNDDRCLNFIRWNCSNCIHGPFPWQLSSNVYSYRIQNCLPSSRLVSLGLIKGLVHMATDICRSKPCFN